MRLKASSHATKRTFNVADPPFHALGSGGDDAPGLQRAIDTAVSSGGGTILLPTGTYHLNTGHLQFSSDERGAGHVALIGAHKTGSRLVLGDLFGACIYDSSPGLHDLWVQNLTFDAGALDRMCCIVLSRSVANVTFVDCAFVNAKNHYAVTIGNVSDRSAGVAGTNLRFVRCTFSSLDCGTYEALLYQNARHGEVRDCTFTGYAGSACALGLYGYVEDVEVRGNTFTGANRGGDIYTQQCARINIISNHHTAGAPTASSIQVKNSIDVRIEDNEITGALVEGRGASDGVQIYDYSGDKFDGVHQSAYPDSMGITVVRNTVRNTFHGFSVPSHAQSAQQNRAQKIVTVEDNTFSSQFSSPIAIGAPTVQDIQSIVLARNIIENPPGALRGDAGLIDVACNRGFAPTALAQDVSRSVQAQTVTLSGNSTIIAGQAVDVDEGDALETVEPTQTAPGSISAIFLKDHRRGAPCVPSAQINRKGIADIAITGNTIVASGGVESAAPAIRIDGVAGGRIEDNDLRGAERAVLASPDAELTVLRNRVNGPELVRTSQQPR
jgi:hypothetical protein